MLQTGSCGASLMQFFQCYCSGFVMHCPSFVMHCPSFVMRCMTINGRSWPHQA